MAEKITFRPVTVLGGALTIGAYDPDFWEPWEQFAVTQPAISEPWGVAPPYYWDGTQRDIYDSIPRCISLLMSGVRPDDPANHVHCGRYPGIMYPHPSTLYLPGVIDLNESQYTQLNPPSVYTPGYTGLGTAKPANNIGDPGFLLGMFDTYSRMACYLNFWQGVRAGTNNSGPVIPMAITLKNYVSQLTSQLQFSDIYPTFGENPTDFIENLIPNIEYTPVNHPFDFEKFRGIMSHGGYNGIPEQFRNYFDQMWTIAKTFETPIRKGYWGGQVGTFDASRDRPYTLGAEAPTWHGYYSLLFDTFCQTMPKTQAIALINGDGEWHGHGPHSYDYRSIPELIAILNIVPLQATYSKMIGWKDLDPENYPNSDMSKAFPEVAGVGRVQILIHVVNPTANPIDVRIQGSVVVDRGPYADHVAGAGEHDEFVTYDPGTVNLDAEWISRMHLATAKNNRVGGVLRSNITCTATVSNRYNHDGHYFGIGQNSSDDPNTLDYTGGPPDNTTDFFGGMNVGFPPGHPELLLVEWHWTVAEVDAGENFGIEQTSTLPIDSTLSLQPGLNSIAVDLQCSNFCGALPPCTVETPSVFGPNTFAPNNADNRLDDITLDIQIGDYFSTTVKLDNRAGWGNYSDFGAADPPDPPNPFV